MDAFIVNGFLLNVNVYGLAQFCNRFRKDMILSDGVILVASRTRFRFPQAGRAGKGAPQLWTYRITCKSATQETPFALAFGTKAVAPIEVGLVSPRVKFTNAEHNEESLHLNLDLLEEKREQALKCAEDY